MLSHYTIEQLHSLLNEVSTSRHGHKHHIIRAIQNLIAEQQLAFYMYGDMQRRLQSKTLQELDRIYDAYIGTNLTVPHILHRIREEKHQEESLALLERLI